MGLSTVPPRATGLQVTNLGIGTSALGNMANASGYEVERVRQEGVVGHLGVAGRPVDRVERYVRTGSSVDGP